MKKIVLIGIIGLTALAIIAGLYLWSPWKKEETRLPKEETTISHSKQQEILGGVERRGQMLYKKKHYQSLIATYQKVLNAAPDSLETKKRLAKVYYELGAIELELGDKESAEKKLDMALDLDPTNAEARRILRGLR